VKSAVLVVTVVIAVIVVIVVTVVTAVTVVMVVVVAVLLHHHDRTDEDRIVLAVAHGLVKKANILPF
jgi:hypothetical protein